MFNSSRWTTRGFVCSRPSKRTEEITVPSTQAATVGADDESAGATWRESASAEAAIADTARANKPRNVVLRRGIDVNVEFREGPRDSIGASPLQNDSGDDKVWRRDDKVW